MKPNGDFLYIQVEESELPRNKLRGATFIRSHLLHTAGENNVTRWGLRGLSLGILWCLASTLESVFFTLLDPWISGQQTMLA